MKQEKHSIQCYSMPEYGHMIPLIRIAQILTSTSPNYQVTIFSSQFFVTILKGQYPSVCFQGIDDGFQTKKDYLIARDSYRQFMIRDFFLPLYKEHFVKKKKHPNLVVADIFSKAAIQYAYAHNLKCIINNILPYGFSQDILTFPKLSRSFSFGGFTTLYPKASNPFKESKGFSGLQDLFRNRYKIFFNTSFGLESATSKPPNHIFTGLLPLTFSLKTDLDEPLVRWLNKWKGKPKIYISFGSMLQLAESFVAKLVKAVEKTGYPTIWSLSKYSEKVDSQLIFHRKWMPQESILSLQDIKVFISHCGSGAVSEAVASQTPVIAIPSFGDQPYNANLIQKNEIGVSLSSILIDDPEFNPQISAETIIEAIGEVMNCSKYLQNMKRVKQLCSLDKTEQIVSNQIERTLKFGDDHLMDFYFEEITKREKLFPTQLRILILLTVVVILTCLTRLTFD